MWLGKDSNKIEHSVLNIEISIMFQSNMYQN